MQKSSRKEIISSINDILWMAKRYSDGRQTYAPDMFNDALDVLVEHFDLDLDRLCRVDDWPIYANNLTAPYALYDTNKRAALRWKPRKLYLDHYRFEQQVVDYVMKNYKTGGSKKGNHVINIVEPSVRVIQKIIKDVEYGRGYNNNELNECYKDIAKVTIVSSALLIEEIL